ncbi:ATP-binding protein [Pseudomonas sp. RT6P73]
MLSSLRLRLMFAATILAVLFMLALMPLIHGAFTLALQDAIEQRLASDVATLISAARIENGHLQMPEQLPDERFNLTGGRLLGYIYDRDGGTVWRSSDTPAESINYTPHYDDHDNKFARLHQANDQEFFVYDVQVKLLGGQSTSFSFVAFQSVNDYELTLKGLRKHLYLGFGAAFLVLLGVLWIGLTWGLKALRRLSQELDEIESGARQSLGERHPLELLRLTSSLNRLLYSEHDQRRRYRDSLDDLAHSLKTPLAVLQGVIEGIALREQDRGQARVLQTQIERMSQQISYQLRRASLRKTGLVRHQVRLQPVLKSLCDTLDKVYRDKRVRVTLALSEQSCVPIEQGALLEMMGNLLENAYRLCLSEVRISAYEKRGGVELCVEDDGPGVPADQRARILQRGERLDRLHPGQGIGLAVVKDIIDSYGAQLTLDDSSLGGAAFWICFDVRR